MCFGGLTWIEYNIREGGKEFLVAGFTSLSNTCITDSNLQPLTYYVQLPLATDYG